MLVLSLFPIFSFNWYGISYLLQVKFILLLFWNLFLVFLQVICSLCDTEQEVSWFLCIFFVTKNKIRVIQAYKVHQQTDNELSEELWILTFSYLFGWLFFSHYTWLLAFLILVFAASFRFGKFASTVVYAWADISVELASSLMMMWVNFPPFMFTENFAGLSG